MVLTVMLVIKFVFSFMRDYCGTPNGHPEGSTLLWVLLDSHSLKLQNLFILEIIATKEPLSYFFRELSFTCLLSTSILKTNNKNYR